MLSSSKNLSNEMRIIEDSSVKFIPLDNYYILKCTVTYDSPNFAKNFDNIAESMLHADPQPILVYYSYNKMFLLFSSVNFASCEIMDDVEITNKQHQYNGNHNLIVSKYVRYFTIHLDNVNDISVEIIQFTTQTQIFIYLYWVLIQIYQENMMRMSDGKITSKEIQFFTEDELINILKKSGVEWQNLKSKEKYGIFLRLRHNKNKTIITKLSELFDVQNEEKYLKFIF
jgi:hypothetical protein